MNERTYKIESVYTLLQPLSHIGESESTTSFLNEIKVLNDGKPETVFAYTGNAIRGQWRDSGAMYLLNKLQIKVPKKAFHLLFSGGSIGGTQDNDVEQAKALRATLPFLSIFGGGVGNQILSGKMTQTFALPVCAETSNIIPSGRKNINYGALKTSCRRMTAEIEFTRKDDSKAEMGDEYIAHIAEDGQATLLEAGTEKKTKKKNEDGPATQMRYRVEYMIPGVQLWHKLVITCTQIELGALVASIHEWAKKPFLGGMGGKGFGLVDLAMEIVEEGEIKPFIFVRDGDLALTDIAKEAKDQYDVLLKTLYDQVLESSKNEIVTLLDA